MKHTSIPLVLVFFALVSCKTSTDPFSGYDTSAGPTILGKGSLSSDSIQWNNIYTPATKEFYFTKNKPGGSVISKYLFEDGVFTNLEIMNFDSGAPYSDVFVSETGDMMLLSSSRKESDSDSILNFTIWKSERNNGSWSTLKPFLRSDNKNNYFYPWMTESKNLYFSRASIGTFNSNIYVSKWNGSKYLDPISLPANINTDQLEGDPFVAPDESYLIFAGFGRDQNLGKSDLYISFNENGSWTDPVWLGEQINSIGYDGSPFVTFDGNYLIFTSSRGSTDTNTFFNHYIISFNPDLYKDK